jgi:succinate dehydrogenase / fumarate reductase membrane anchor subunit
MVFAVLRLAAGDYQFAVHWIAQPLNAVLMVLLLGISFWHMAAGMRVIVEDYIHVTLNKSALLILNLFVCGLAGALAIFSILKVAFGGGAY